MLVSKAIIQNNTLVMEKKWLLLSQKRDFNIKLFL